MQQLGLFWLAAQRSLFSIEKLPLKDRQGLTSGGKYSLDEVEVTHCSRPKCPAAVQAWLPFLACFGIFQSALNHCGGPKEHHKPVASPALGDPGQLADHWGWAVLHIPPGAAQEEKDELP